VLYEIIKRRIFSILLHRIDEEIASQYRQRRCPCCGGPLHQSNYMRKPRGETESLPEECQLRFSNCCGWVGCRTRALPPSVKFLDRKVYWACIHLVAMCLRQFRPNGWTARKVMMTLDVSEKTLSRWARYWREVFPASHQWKELRGKVIAKVRDADLPGALLNVFLQREETQEDALVGCLRFLAGVSTPEVAEHGF